MTKIRKRWVGGAASAVLLAGLGVAWLAPTSFAQPEIQVLDHEGPYEKNVDVGKEGLSPGDVTLGSHQLFDAADPTSVVGRDFERITVLRIVSKGQDFDFLYDSTLRFADGDIVLYGEGRISEVFTPEGVTIPVIAGTGTYRGMEGAATVTATQTEGEFLITVDLVAG